MKSRTNTTAKKVNESKGALYISFNKDEWIALQKLGFRERWAYMQLKWMASFKTGMLGNYRKQKVTFQDIANLVTAPGVQGRGQGNIDDTQAAEFLQRMELVGLVVMHGRRPNGGLLMELPLSPINRKASVLPAPGTQQVNESELISPEQMPKIDGISPDEERSFFDENPVSMRVAEEFPPSLSVLSLTKLKNNTVEAQAASAADASPSRDKVAAAVPGYSRQNPAWVAPMTVDEIHEAITENWEWAEVDTPQAWSLYEAWAKTGVTEDILFQAVSELESSWSNAKGPCTPIALAPVLNAVLRQNRLAA